MKPETAKRNPATFTEIFDFPRQLAEKRWMKYGKTYIEAVREIERRADMHEELLEAAKSATGYFQMLEDKTGVIHPVLKELRSAIAKAEGRV